MNDYYHKIAEIEDLCSNRREMTKETFDQLKKEVDKFIAVTNNDDLNEIMKFIIEFVGQDSYNQGVQDALSILRSKI